MDITGNTILITGGGSGIGRALAEAFHKRDNVVVIAGRREATLRDVVAANPGMLFLTLDIADPSGIRAFADAAVSRFPRLNAVVNNAGIMKAEAIPGAAYLDIAEETVATNLLGPIRLTAALLPHLLRQARSTVLTVSSGLAFVPMAMTPTYSATKAAIHAYSMTLRQQLKDTTTEVIEIAPPYVQTGLMGDRQRADPRAMPLAAFIDEVMLILEAGPASGEVIVERCKPLRFAAENGAMAAMFDAINAMAH